MSPSKLLRQVRSVLRVRHFSRRTEDTYVQWIRRFIQFHGVRHPLDLGGAEVAQFLTNLAVERRVSASTQNQALNALLFLYRSVLQRDVRLEGVVPARRATRAPVVLSRPEVQAILRRLHGVSQLVALLLYGSGLRLLE
ncbi:MAG: phage integrase N-terminal SAM-like domain-containing protein, partial [Gemmatimonadetes bacterium]|nr:phage integrase N-terminal SAM-like domain-containing protein [Gemmatimonadota bacterium]